MEKEKQLTLEEQMKENQKKKKEKEAKRLQDAQRYAKKVKEGRDGNRRW